MHIIGTNLATEPTLLGPYIDRQSNCAIACFDPRDAPQGGSITPKDQPQAQELVLWAPDLDST